MLVHLFEIVLLIASISAGCTDSYTNYAGANSDPSMIIATGNTYVCNYDKKTVAGTMVRALEKCNLTCPADSQLIAVEPSRVAETILLKAYFDSQTWHAVPAAPAATYQLGSAMQFGCTIRCVKYIDGTGTLFPTRCNVVDMAAVCNEDQSLSLCTCSAGYTGSTCGVSMLPLDKKKEMSWTKDEVIDSAGFEMEDLNVESAITQVFDEQLGNCYTFNYANQTNSKQGLFTARVAGQSRNFTIDSKLHPEEQVAWIETAAITTYIHAPGTPPKQGITYSVIAAESNLLALRKKITQLSYGCISSKKELKTNYYEDGEYTKEGCYFACYQDKVLEKCGCMDARLKKADTSSQCLFKDNDCVDSVTQQFGDVSSWQSCKCPSECYQEMYSLTATRSGLPFKTASCANDTTGCPEVSTTIARLTIYIESLENEVYVEQEKLSLSSMLSNIGNQLGFLLGMSIVGIIEILILCAQLGKEQFTKKQ